jgi:hypothetical protein
MGTHSRGGFGDVLGIPATTAILHRCYNCANFGIQIGNSDNRKGVPMAHWHKFSLIAAALLATGWAIPSANAAEPPANLCSLLPAADISKTLGQTYGAPDKSAAPRPFAGTNEGTDCNYHAKGSKLWFRAYVDPSPAAAKELFAKLAMFYAPPTPVKGLGDEAYFDPQHALHVRKGKVRFYINLSPMEASKEKQLQDLGAAVVGRL